MKKLAIFWHGKMYGGTPAIVPYARQIMAEHMDLLVTTGLYDAANLIVIGLNHFPNQTNGFTQLIPPGAEVVWHGDNAESELPTLDALRQWLPRHQDWYVLYFHAKGATHNRDPLTYTWRKCMERAVILNWKQCVQDLDAGADTVGAHWLTREKYGDIVKTFFWGGNFWWAKASFLNELPPIPSRAKCRDDFFLAETWIGTGRRPVVRDYADHWPGLKPCSGK